MNDVSSLRDTIAPKSDRVNADDFMAGPETVTITAVKRGDADTPVAVHIEGRKPYYPCKSMRRVLISAWGDNGADWVGKSMTLFTDPSVKFGGVAVGGIRISHLSHIERDLALSLTATRGKRTPYTVRKLAATQTAPAPAAAYPADQFAAKLPAMRQAIADGKMTAEQVIARCEQTGALTAEQRTQIIAPIQAETTEEEIF
jgi:hypothetical protein